MGDTYNVFISWSGERSKLVASALYDWLPMVVQSARPWMSAEDIEKGSRGLVEIGKALEKTSVGLVCLTPENLESPWVLFEAGALSKALDDKTRVCPYLFGGVRPEDVKPPLGMFQGTMAVKDDTRQLVGTMNKALAGSLNEEKLETVFERMWPELEGKLKAIAEPKKLAVKPRTEREMLAEILELARSEASRRDAAARALGAELQSVRETLPDYGLYFRSGINIGTPGFMNIAGDPTEAKLERVVRMIDALARSAAAELGPEVEKQRRRAEALEELRKVLNQKVRNSNLSGRSLSNSRKS